MSDNLLGFIVLLALAALTYAAFLFHPIAGIAAAFLVLSI